MSVENISESGDSVLTHCFPAQARELAHTRSRVRQILSQLRCSIHTTEEVVIAIDEACQNIIRHAYRQDTQEEIALMIQREADVIVVTIRDHARRVPADCIHPREQKDLRPGGLGCHFMQQLMDTVSLEQAADGKGNVLRMTKELRERKR